MMTDLEQKFVALAAKKEALKEEMKVISEEAETAMRALGLGHVFQDDAGLVYKIVEPAGKYQYFEKIDYVRTKKPDERAGTLSKTEAKALGYEVL